MESEELSLNSAIPFAGRYILKKLLGSGGMGAVYLATDSMLGDDEVALKILHSQLCQNEKHTKRFLREVQLTRKVTHPNVVRTFDAGRENGRLYFTMEYAQGVTLKEKLAAGPMDLEQCASILREISKGLYAIHQADIIHRDLKPGNVLLTPEGFIKITDFGVAKPGVSDLTGHNEVIGSIPYMAPEVWVGRNVGPAADFYALGVVAYEMATGGLPFEAESPVEMMCKHLETVPVPPIELRPEMPMWLNDLILRMLQKDQIDRPSGAEEIVKFLNEQGESGVPVASVVVPESRSKELGLEEEALELEDPSFGLRSPATLDEPQPSVFERMWAGNTPKTKDGYIAMPQVEVPDESDFAGFSPKQRAGRHAALFLGCLVFCALGIWRFETVTGSWLSARWIASQQVPILSKIVSNIVLSFAFYAAIFSMPLFLLASVRRDLRNSVRIWMRGAVCLGVLLMVQFAVFFGKAHLEGSRAGIPLGSQRILSSAEAAIVNSAELALLAPRGTVFTTAISPKGISLTESPAGGFWALLPYWCFLSLYVIYLVRVLERDVLRRRQCERRFRNACAVLFFAIPIAAELFLLWALPAAQQLFAIRDVLVSAGVLSHSFDRYTILCLALNWLVVLCAVVFIIPFGLRQLQKRRR
ncbi:MAG: serine/threonine protein kinase [Deltaproteobacteria bacterium]|nr:serine/threonine protein kinase [Deltaproteobacteria bacterium]